MSWIRINSLMEFVRYVRDFRTAEAPSLGSLIFT
jgi:hypothetical protein